MPVLRNSRETRIKRYYTSGVKRRDSFPNRAAYCMSLQAAGLAICQTKYVILSVSEISHDQSEKYMHCQLFGGILHYRSE